MSQTLVDRSHRTATSAAPLEQLAAGIAARARRRRCQISAWHRPVGLVATTAAAAVVVLVPRLLPWLLLTAAGAVALALVVAGSAALRHLVQQRRLAVRSMLCSHGATARPRSSARRIETRGVCCGQLV